MKHKPKKPARVYYKIIMNRYHYEQNGLLQKTNIAQKKSKGVFN